MVGVETIRRGTKSEDDAIERDYRYNERMIYGSEAGIPQGSNDDMATFIAGDVHLPPEPKPQPEKKIGGVQKLLIGSAIGAGLLTSGAYLGSMLQQKPPEQKQPEKKDSFKDTDTTRMLEPDK